MLSRPDKDALRAMLESQVQEKLQHDPDALTTYAAKPEPERKRYTSKPTVCSGLMKPDTHLGENARQIEVSDDQATSFLFR